MTLCFNFNCPKRISVHGDYRTVEQFNINIAGWHSGQHVLVQVCLPFCTDACALHYLETDSQGEDLPAGQVKNELVVLESVMLAHQRWFAKNNGGDRRRYSVDPSDPDVCEPNYQDLSLPRHSDGVAVVSRVRVPTTWQQGESYAAMAFGFDSIATRAEFSRRLVTTDEKLTFFVTRARQAAGITKL